MRHFTIVCILALATCALVGLVNIRIATAHGAAITYTIAPTVHVIATFDSGEPMVQAQVIVYAPDNPTTPWLTGETDENGGFSFVPDPTVPGDWAVQVRQAGHGDILTIPVGAEGAALTGDTGGFTPLQIVVMAAAVIWGMIGTALYFSNRKAAPTREEN